MLEIKKKPQKTHKQTKTENKQHDNKNNTHTQLKASCEHSA